MMTWVCGDTTEELPGSDDDDSDRVQRERGN